MSAARAILRNCRQAMSPNGQAAGYRADNARTVGRIAGTSALAWTDLAMLLSPGGRQRTEAEFCALLRDPPVLPSPERSTTALDYSIIECISN